MNTISFQHTSDRRRRRLHGDEFKANAIALAAQPDMSTAAVAMSLGINANPLHRWVRDAELQLRRPEPIDVPKVLLGAAAYPDSSGFVLVQLPVPPGDVRIEVRRDAVYVVVTWPAVPASECGGWLRDRLR